MPSRLGLWVLVVATVFLAVRPELHADPVKCRAGAYITGLSPVDFGARTINVDLYAWLRCPKSIAAESMALTVVAASAEERGEAYDEELGEERYHYERIRATLRVPVSLRAYPFDRQVIPFDLESARETVETLRFELDDDPALRGSPRCCLDETVTIPDWKLQSLRAFTSIHRYQTRFGYGAENPDAHAFARLRLELVLHREVQGYLLKVLLPLLIILAMAVVSCWWPVENLDAISNVHIAALLSVVAVHFTQRGELPNTGYLVRGDWFLIHAYFLLFLLLVGTTVAHGHHQNGNASLASRWQRGMRLMAPSVLLLGWGAIVWWSVRRL